jgi:hypothetical protein
MAGLAERIVADGFEDRSHGDGRVSWGGTWFTDQPVTWEDSSGSEGAAVVVEIPAEVAAPYRVVERYGLDPERLREWLIPANILNRYPRSIARGLSADQAGG